MSTTPTPTPHDLDDDVVVTAAELDRVREHMRANLERYLGEAIPAGLDPAAAEVRVRRFGETSSYPLYGADVWVPHRDTPVLSTVVKFAPVFSDNNEGLTEYRHLRVMWDRLGGDEGELRVPRPLDFYEDVNALVMERVGGERFSRELLRAAGLLSAPGAGRRMRDAATLCGRWLAVYHAANPAGREAPFGDAFAADIDGKLSRLERWGFPRGVGARAREVSGALGKWGTGATVAVADKHGDYGPQNVHLGDGYVCVFDLNYNVAAPVYEDLVYFLVTLETLNPFPRQLAFDRRRVMALTGPFLEGYFGRAPNEQEAFLIEGYYLKALLFRCGKQRRNTSKRGRLALRAFDWLRLRRYYAWRVDSQCRRVMDTLAQIEGGA